jgi:hypothetical protein
MAGVLTNATRSGKRLKFCNRCLVMLCRAEPILRRSMTLHVSDDAPPLSAPPKCRLQRGRHSRNTGGCGYQWRCRICRAECLTDAMMHCIPEALQRLAISLSDQRHRRYNGFIERQIFRESFVAAANLCFALHFVTSAKIKKRPNMIDTRITHRMV